MDDAGILINPVENILRATKDDAIFTRRLRAAGLLG